MRNLTTALALLALSLACAPRAVAQSRQPEPVRSFGSCVAIQTKATTTEMPMSLRGEGTCTTTAGGSSTCTAEIVPSGPDIILDVSDINAMPQCLPVSTADSCAAVQNGPVLFQSQRHATQMYSTGGSAVRITVMIHQIRLQHTTTDQPPGARFPLNVGRMFDALSWTLANFRCSETAILQLYLMLAGIFVRSPLRPGPTKNSVYPHILGHSAHPPLRKLAKVKLRNRDAVAARLECTMADGDPRIFPIVGDADPGPNIRFVSKNSAEPTFEILTYRVVP